MCTYLYLYLYTYIYIYISIYIYDWWLPQTPLIIVLAYEYQIILFFKGSCSINSTPYSSQSTASYACVIYDTVRWYISTILRFMGGGEGTAPSRLPSHVSADAQASATNSTLKWKLFDISRRSHIRSFCIY